MYNVRFPCLHMLVIVLVVELQSQADSMLLQGSRLCVGSRVRISPIRPCQALSCPDPMHIPCDQGLTPSGQSSKYFFQLSSYLSRYHVLVPWRRCGWAPLRRWPIVACSSICAPTVVSIPFRISKAWGAKFLILKPRPHMFQTSPQAGDQHEVVVCE
jgi:hypothetical protein